MSRLPVIPIFMSNFCPSYLRDDTKSPDRRSKWNNKTSWTEGDDPDKTTSSGTIL